MIKTNMPYLMGVYVVSMMYNTGSGSEDTSKIVRKKKGGFFSVFVLIWVVYKFCEAEIEYTEIYLRTSIA